MDNNMYNQDPQLSNNYQQPYTNQPQGYYQPAGTELEEPMSIKEWLIIMLVMCIPCVNIVMMFVWAFGSGKKSRSNYFKASLIVALIAIVLWIILVAILGVSAFSALSTVSSY